MLTKRDLLRSAAVAVITVPMVKSAPVSAQSKPEWPDIREAKAIAEEGFIYGLPIVMNYAVMYEFSVDSTNSQFKAPFNQIKNLAHVATYKDTAVVTPNSDTPYSTLWFDLRAEPLVVSVPAVEKTRYYTVQLIDGNTFNFGYIGSRATGNDPGDYMVVGPNWQELIRPESRKCSNPRPSLLSLPFAPNYSTRQTCRTSRRFRPATRRSRFRPISNSPRHQLHPRSIFPKSTRIS